jgi:hypothetical protein
MIKLLVQYNKHAYNWTIYLDKKLFHTVYIKKNLTTKQFFSKLSKKYLILLIILRNFGLVKPLKNFKDY